MIRAVNALFIVGTLTTIYVFLDAAVRVLVPHMTGTLQFTIPLALTVAAVVPWASARRRHRHPNPTGESHVR